MSPPRAFNVKEVRPPNPLAAVQGDSSVATKLLPVVPMEGKQKVAAGQAFDFVLEGEISLVEFSIDIPEDVQVDISINKNPVASVNDGAGLVGSFRTGDFTGEAHMSATEVRLKGKNNGTEDRDVRAWVLVVL